MAMNRIQFQKGLSVAEFIKHYGNEQQCLAALEASRWPNGFRCPHCGDDRHSIFERHGKKHWQCYRCRSQTTLTAGTIFQSTKLALTTWFLAIYLLTQSKNNVSTLELKRQLGVCYKTAWYVKHKLLQVMYEREQRRVLTDRVEMDDAYLGGEREGKAGRGSENKVPFVAAVQTNPQGHPLYVCLRQLPFTKAAIEAWANQSLAASAVVVSDGLSCFRIVGDVVEEHTRITVGSGRQSVKRPEFRWVNTLLGNLKTAISGTYHAFKYAKYANRYLAEFQYRFNRRFDLASMLTRLLRAAACTRPCSGTHLRSAEECR